MDSTEFWLPPQFLTDDDTLFGLKNNNNSKLGEENGRRKYFGCDFQNEFSYGFNMFGPHSDLSSPVESVVGSTETESEEEQDYITELTRQTAYSTLENYKVQILSSSPQSTLCGVLGSKQGSNSESLKYPSQMEGESRKGTVDLLYAAVGEVARMKMQDKNGIWAPPRKTSPVYVDPNMCKPNLGSFYSNQPPPLSYTQLQMAQFQRLKQLQIMKQGQGIMGPKKNRFWQYPLTQGRDRNGADRPFNIAKSAWPIVQQSHHRQPPQKQPAATAQPGSGMHAVFLGNLEPKRECAGTGVFIPRRVRTQTETRKKPGSTVLLPDKLVQALNLNMQPQVEPRFNNNGGGVLKYQNNNVAAGQQWRSLRSQPAAISQELQLPQEWTY